MESINIEYLSKIIEIDKNDIISIFQFGSIVYETNNEKSDFDLIIVIPNYLSHLNDKEIIYKNLNIHLITEYEFRDNIQKHRIESLECIFSPQQFILKNETKYDFEIDLPTLRKEISSKSNNSFVKAKKKMILIDEDSYIGLKSLFHSFRILDFGIQIAKYEKIKEYNSITYLWNELLNDYKNNNDNWDFYYEKYKKRHNQLSSEFKKLAPKKLRNILVLN